MSTYESAILGGSPVIPLPEGQEIPRLTPASELELELVREVLERGKLGLGDWNPKAAERFAELVKVRHVVLCTNGSHALTLALRTLKIKEGQLAYVPGSTFQATAGACLDAKVVPALADVKPRNLTIDPDWVEADLERREANGEPIPAVMFVVPLYHRVPDMPRLRQIADDHGMKIVLDFAHGPYAELFGVPITDWADIVTWSFQQSKSLPLGEGGAVSTNDPDLFPRLRRLVSCGYNPVDLLKAEGIPADERGVVPPSITLPPQFADAQSVNYRMTELQAALLWARLEPDRYPTWRDTAIRTMPQLDEVISQFDWLHPSEQIDGVNLPPFYHWAFWLDPSFGMDIELFRKALQAELNYECVYCYPALTQGDPRNPYHPTTLRDTLTDEDYLTQITNLPELPIAERAIEEAVNIEWRFLLEPDAPAHLEHALHKISRERDAINTHAPNPT